VPASPSTTSDRGTGSPWHRTHSARVWSPTASTSSSSRPMAIAGRTSGSRMAGGPRASATGRRHCTGSLPTARGDAIRSAAWGRLRHLVPARRALAVLGNRARARSMMRYHADVHIDDAFLRAALADDVRRGLGAREKWLPPKYFYDGAGSALFERITRLAEYYL